MHLIKYGEGWTRRHFMRQMVTGTVAAGVLLPLFDVIGRHGDCAAAYPAELLSIEAYTKGKLKPGDVLNADNVDIVKDLLDEVAYWQVKHDGRTINLIATETDVNRLCAPSYMEATLRNRGVHRIGPDGNIWTREGKPWIGGNPFPQATSAEELLLQNALTLTFLYYDTVSCASREWETDANGDVSYTYDYLFAGCHTVGRITVDPKPYLPGHETQLRVFSLFMAAPQDMNGVASLEIWPYDQHKMPIAHAYSPQTKRIRSVPDSSRFETSMPGAAWFASDTAGAGDPVYTWGNFKIVGQGPFLAATHGNCHFGYPDWQVPLVGGKSGKKYFRTYMELVPEGYVVEMEPVGYPNCPYSKKRSWFDARTGIVPLIVTYDRESKPFHQCEWFYDYAVRKPGIQWPEGMPDSFWASYLNMHMYDMKSGRMSRMGIVPEISGGLRSSIDNPRLYEQFCTLDAIRRQGR
jgi:hypothetical protein